MALSIIIVNWNTKQLLHNCLRSIYENAKNIDFEIIVVDNASSDGSVEMVKSEFPYIKLIENQQNLGFATANNQAIRQSCGSYILLLNSDTIIIDGAIERTLDFMEKHPESGAVGCRLLNSDRSLQHSCYNFGSLARAIIFNLKLDKTIFHNNENVQTLLKNWTHDEVRVVDYVRGAFLMMSKKALDDVGLLDEKFFMYAEEADICYRLKHAGWKIYFFPGAEVIHLGKQSSKSTEGEREIQQLVSRILFFRKQYGSFYALIYKMLSVILSLLRIISSLWGFIDIGKSTSIKQELKKQLLRIKVIVRLEEASNLRKRLLV